MRDEVPNEIVIQIRAHQVRARYTEQNTRSMHGHALYPGDLLRLPVPTASEVPCILDDVQ